ncbi:MAG: agmatine/peptidylarginine deiminase [Cytophagales bacterium]
MMQNITKPPKGFRMPAEWESHASTWLSWPHNKDTWPMDGKYQAMIKQYCHLIGTLAQFELVNINIGDIELENEAKQHLRDNGFSDLSNIKFHYFKTNDAWCRDHGPIFITNERGEKAITNWQYNAWGGKYPPFDADNNIPQQISNLKHFPIFSPDIVMEGGSIEVNGKGTLMTTKACLLNKNRNPHLTQTDIEAYLMAFLGVKHIIWLEDGIVGDDTDGHIDDLSRFVDASTIVTIVEEDETDANYVILKENLETLHSLTDQDSKPFTIVTLPMPAPVYTNGERLPASYANFLIANGCVLVPIFNDKNDQKALDILQSCFADRKVIGIPCRDIVWGLGTIHCMSQQEPL